MTKAEIRRCVDCAHYDYNMDTDTDGYFVGEWAECAKRPTIGNLKSFPFKSTNCKLFISKAKQVLALVGDE